MHKAARESPRTLEHQPLPAPLPGIIVQTAIFGALVTGLGLTEDLKAGVVDRFRSLPISRSAVLVGRTAADLVMSAMTLVVMVAVGIAVGFRPSQPAWQLLLAFALVLAFACVFSVDQRVRRPEGQERRPRIPAGLEALSRAPGWTGAARPRRAPPRAARRLRRRSACVAR